jgi:hypothetical protein
MAVGLKMALKLRLILVARYRNQCNQTLLKLDEQSVALATELAKTKHSLQDTREALHEVTLPSFIYSYTFNTGQLHRTDLDTGEQSSHQLPSYTFKPGCCWSEVPGGSLYITGGHVIDSLVLREVVRIDVGTFEVSHQREMHTPRAFHAAVHHTQHLYILGGWSGSSYLSECEKYVCAEDRWEALDPLPKACRQMSGVVVESSLYALGGRDARSLNLVQKYSLESLTWELMHLRLPRSCFSIPCFKLTDTEVYLVIKKKLYRFTDLEVKPLNVNDLTNIKSWYGASYYRRRTLYCSNHRGAVRSHKIGSLSDL